MSSSPAPRAVDGGVEISLVACGLRSLSDVASALRARGAHAPSSVRALLLHGNGLRSLAPCAAALRLPSLSLLNVSSNDLRCLDGADVSALAPGVDALDAAACGLDSVRARAALPSPVTPADLPRLFDRFYRTDKSRRAGGSGLGLSIVRQVAELHGGSAAADPVRPKGLRIMVTLPASA